MKTLYKKLSLVLLLLTIISTQISFSQVLISNSTGTPDNSAMLEVSSTTKGMLIPRMDSDSRKAISSPKEGLLVFDTDFGSFFIYGKTAEETPGWIDLSTDAGIWTKNDTCVFLSNPKYNVGIGTNTPNRKFVLKAENDNDTLFEIQDKNGKPLMLITPTLTKFYFHETKKKGIAGGFAVGRYATAKATDPDTALFIVTPDSTRVYTSGLASTVEAGGFAVGRYATAKGSPIKFFNTNIHNTRVYTDGDAKKGIAGGFAVGRYATAKGENVKKYFYADIDSTRVYTDGSGKKGIAGGFAVGRYATAKAGGKNSYMYMIPDNYFIGDSSGLAIQEGNGTGKYNTFFGFKTGMFNNSGMNNVFVGYKSGLNNINGNDNVFLGDRSGFSNTSGYNNVFLGKDAGTGNISGLSNTFVGENSGSGNTSGNYNAFYGYEAGKDIEGGNRNTFVGTQAGQLADGGNNNVFLGFNAGAGHHLGDDNVFLGNGAGRGLSTATGTSEKNVILGYQAGMNISEAQNNVFIGYRAAGDGLTNNKSVNNVIIGKDAGTKISEGRNNVFVGSSSALKNTTGSNNVMIGDSAGYSNTTGLKNISIGHVAGFSNQTAVNNISIGDSAGYYNSVENNIFIGTNAGKNTTTGRYNVFLGQGAGYSTTDNGANTYIGTLAGANNNENNNVMVGNLSGYKSTTARKSIFIGDGAGYYNNDSCNIFLGFAAGAGNDGNHNIFIGKNTYTYNQGNNNVFIGNNLTTLLTLSDRLYIENGGDMSRPLIYGKFDDDQVGINTTNPQGDLHVVGSDELGRIVVAPNEIGTGEDAEICLAEDDDYTSGMSMKYDGGDDKLYFFGKNGATDYGPHMSIDRDNGDIGIGMGTANPSGKVEIRYNSEGTIPTLRLVETVANDGARLIFSNSVETSNRWTLYGRADNTQADNTFNIYNNLAGNVLTAKGNGYIGIGTNSPQMRLHVKHDNGAGSKGFLLEHSGSNNNNWSFYVSNSNGNLQIYDNGTYKGKFLQSDGTYVRASDKRLKENISLIPSVIENVKKLRVVDYYFKSDKLKKQKSLGLIAQDVVKLFPLLVSKPEDGDGVKYYSMDYSGFGVIAIKAIQEQQAQIENQNNKIDIQNNKIKSLEKQIQELKDLIQNK